jgi:hypothetical protein
MTIFFQFDDYPFLNGRRAGKVFSGTAEIKPIGSRDSQTKFHVKSARVAGRNIYMGTPEFGIFNIWLRAKHDVNIIEALKQDLLK